MDDVIHYLISYSSIEETILAKHTADLTSLLSDDIEYWTEKSGTEEPLLVDEVTRSDWIRGQGFALPRTWKCEQCRFEVNVYNDLRE